MLSHQVIESYHMRTVSSSSGCILVLYRIIICDTGMGVGGLAGC